MPLNCLITSSDSSEPQLQLTTEVIKTQGVWGAGGLKRLKNRQSTVIERQF